MLWSLLNLLLNWAREEHVPMREGAVQAAKAVLAKQSNINNPSLPGRAIHEFLEQVEVPLLVLCGECRLSFAVL
jgi:hypothetical protein